MHEPGLADQIEGLRAESRARRGLLPDASRTLSSDTDGLGEQPLLFAASPIPARIRAPIRGRRSHDGAAHDRRHHLRVEHDAHRGNEERRWHLVPIEEVENPRQGRRRPVFPDRQGHGQDSLAAAPLSTSNERQTATRAPLGQALGVSFLPTLAVPTTCRICSSVESTVIGFTAAELLA